MHNNKSSKIKYKTYFTPFSLVCLQKFASEEGLRNVALYLAVKYVKLYPGFGPQRAFEFHKPDLKRKKYTITVGQNSRYPVRDFNWTPPEYKSEASLL
jgi:hypothetical protein